MYVCMYITIQNYLATVKNFIYHSKRVIFH